MILQKKLMGYFCFWQRDRHARVKTNRMSFLDRQHCVKIVQIRTTKNSVFVQQGVSQKIKTDNISSKLGSQAIIYQRSPPWLATRNFFCYNLQNARKRHPGKEIFQNKTLYNTNKSPLRNLFFFVYFSLFFLNLVGIWNRNTQFIEMNRLNLVR